MYLPPYAAESVRTNPYDNLTSTTDTINKMIGLVQQNVSSPTIQKALDEIELGLGNNTSAEDWCRGIFWYVKKHVKFATDEHTLVQDLGIQDLEDGKELLFSPSYLLQMPTPTGDCDDFSTLIATLLIAAGVQQVFFCTVAADSKDPSAFTHVFVRVMLSNGKMLALDASHGQYPGWETKNQFKQINWPIPVATPVIPVSSTTPTTTTNDTVKDYAQGYATQLAMSQIPVASDVLSQLSPLTYIL